MGFQSRDELEAELAEERDIPPDLLEDGVDQDRLAARPLAEQIGVGRGLRVEQLTEHEHQSPPASDGGRLVPGPCRCGYAAIRALTRQAWTAEGHAGVNTSCRGRDGDRLWVACVQPHHRAI